MGIHMPTEVHICVCAKTVGVTKSGHISCSPLPLSSGNFFKNGTGLSNLFFFLDNPITVFSAPFGLPLFFSLGGSVTS